MTISNAFNKAEIIPGIPCKLNTPYVSCISTIFSNQSPTKLKLYELIPPTTKPNIIEIKTFYIKSAHAPDATPPAIVALSILSIFIFP